jgi:hypothetical protein
MDKWIRWRAKWFAVVEELGMWMVSGTIFFSFFDEMPIMFVCARPLRKTFPGLQPAETDIFLARWAAKHTQVVCSIPRFHPISTGI